MTKRRPIVTRIGPIKPLGKTRAPARRVPPPYRPFRIATRNVTKPIPLEDDPFVAHRRGPYRPDVGEDPREARAVQTVKGSLPERIVYKALVRHHCSPTYDFDFQSSQDGGRLELGGMVADFLFKYWRMIIRVQGPEHDTPGQRAIDSEQRRRLEDMGYTIHDLTDDDIYDMMHLEGWLSRVIDWNPGKGGTQVITDAVFIAQGGLQFAMSVEEEDRLEAVEAGVRSLTSEIQQIPARQVSTITGLSDISESLGLVQAGEFRVGNRKEPGEGFTGVRIAYPATVYASGEWSIAGLNADVLQFGLSAIDGSAYFAAGAGLLDAQGLRLYFGSLLTVWLQADGDSFFGSDLSNPTTTSLSIFSNDQTYNAEAMGAGDVLFGDNGISRANMLWDASAGEILLRGGVATQASINTDGEVVFGGGAGKLTNTGIMFDADLGPTGYQAITWIGDSGAGAWIKNWLVGAPPDQYSVVWMVASAEPGGAGVANIDITAIDGDGDRGDILLYSDSILFQFNIPGSPSHPLALYATEVVVNDDAGDIDLRVEGATIANVLVVNAGLDAAQFGNFTEYIELATSPSTPASGWARVYAKNDGLLYFLNDSGVEYDLTASGGGGGAWTEDVPNDTIYATTATRTLLIGGATLATAAIVLTPDAGSVSVFNEQGLDIDTRFEGDTVINVFVIDAGMDAARFGNFSEYVELAVSPATPSSGWGRLYGKTDGKIYFKNDGGSEYDLTATGSTPPIAVASIPFTDGDTVRRVTISDGGVSASSKIVGSIRRPDSASDSLDKGYLYGFSIVRVGTGSFDVLVQAMGWHGEQIGDDPPNETVTLWYLVG